jgi:hypothetical protein
MFVNACERMPVSRWVCVCAHMCLCVCVCARVHVRACVRARECVYVQARGRASALASERTGVRASGGGEETGEQRSAHACAGACEGVCASALTGAVWTENERWFIIPYGKLRGGKGSFSLIKIKTMKVLTGRWQRKGDSAAA